MNAPDQPIPTPPLTVSPGPHISSGSLTTRRMMIDVLLGLLPLTAFALWQFRMGALDGKLSRLREVHVVDTGRHGRISMDTLLHEANQDEAPPVSIQAVKSWQRSAPLVINERFARVAELAGWLQQAKVPASLVPRSDLPSILLGKAFGAEVLDVAESFKPTP